MGKDNDRATPLRITARLFDGRINSVDGIIMLDSILYHGWFAKYEPHVLEGLGDEDARYIGLPLTKYPYGGMWAASRGIYTETSRSIESYNKSPDFFAADKYDKLRSDGGKKNCISSTVGAYRRYRNSCVIRTCADNKVTFYAKGRADKVRDLLSYIPSIGKKSAMGWGIVTDWIVEETDEDYSIVHPVHGLMRPIEVGQEELAQGVDLSKYPVYRYGVKPPYYKPKNFKLCYVPVNMDGELSGK
ncbi:MAG: hypothetical protein LUI12_10985 [Clostridiales bacterium]|nr:hypothetical protein [Clostridiales bacterium]